MVFKRKKALGPVVATALLIVVAVAAIVGFQTWYQSYQSSIAAEVEQTKTLQIEPQYVRGKKVKVKGSNFDGNVSYSNVLVGDRSCGVNGTLNEGMNDINIGYCTAGMETGAKDVTLVTEEGTYSTTLSLSETNDGSFLVEFKSSSSCGSDYTKLYGMAALSNSHAENPGQNNYNYSACIRHRDAAIGTSCSTGKRLFYLGDVTNSHVWLNNSNAYGSGYNWQKICMDSPDTSFNITVQSSNPQDGSVCVGSLIKDDTYGGHIGDCGSHNTKIWIKEI